MNGLVSPDLALVIALALVVLISTLLGRKIYDRITKPMMGPSLLTFLLARVGPQERTGNKEALTQLGGALLDVVGVYALFLIVYLMSSVLSMLFLQTFAPSAVANSLIEPVIVGFLVVGAIAALLTRVCALYYFSTPVKAFYFQFLLVAGGLALVLAESVLTQSDLVATFLLSIKQFVTFIYGPYLRVLTCLSVAVIATELAVLLPSSKVISYELFREKADSIEEVRQVILGSDIRGAVLSELEAEEERTPIGEIRWITGSGYPDIASWILSRASKVKIKIITTKGVRDRWLSNETLRDWLVNDTVRDNVRCVTDLKSLSDSRLIVVDKRLALKGAPLGSDYATMAVRITDPMRIQPLVLAFDSWYDTLR